MQKVAAKSVALILNNKLRVMRQVRHTEKKKNTVLYGCILNFLKFTFRTSNISVKCKTRTSRILRFVKGNISIRMVK